MIKWEEVFILLFGNIMKKDGMVRIEVIYSCLIPFNSNWREKKIKV